MTLTQQQTLQLFVRIVIFICFIVLAVVNGLSSAGGICGNTNSAVSKLHPTPITPAGYAFSIWGLIFFLQAIFAVVGLSSLFSNRTMLVVGLPVTACWLFEVVWSILFACSTMALQLIGIASALISISCAYVAVTYLVPGSRFVCPEWLERIGHTSTSITSTNQKYARASASKSFQHDEEDLQFNPNNPNPNNDSYSRSRDDAATLSWMPNYRNLDGEIETGSTLIKTGYYLEIAGAFVSTSINTAWLLVATQLSVLIAFGKEQEDGTFTAVSESWGIVGICISASVGILVAVLLWDPFFSGTIIWALIAIEVGNSKSTSVVVTGSIAVVAVALATLYAIVRRVIQYKLANAAKDSFIEQ